MNFTDTEILEISKIAHETMREYKESLGEPLPAWDNAAQWMKDSTVDTIKDIMSDPSKTAEDIHNEWMRQKIASGWKYGPVKDAEQKTNPLLIPFNNLTVQEKIKDSLMSEVCNYAIKAKEEYEKKADVVKKSIGEKDFELAKKNSPDKIDFDFDKQEFLKNLINSYKGQEQAKEQENKSTISGLEM